MSASDSELARGARDGDREAFGQLVHRYQRRLFGLVLMMVRERGAAEEVTQDVFVRATRRSITTKHTGRSTRGWHQSLCGSRKTGFDIEAGRHGVKASR